MSWLPLAVVVVGVLLAVAGVALLSVPVALIVAGVALGATGLLVDFDALRAGGKVGRRG